VSDGLILLWVLGRLIGQDAIDHADGFVADRHEGPLSGTFAGGVGLASLRGGFAMCSMRDEPQDILIEPMSQVGAAHV
jgi:hypothetical protein